MPKEDTQFKSGKNWKGNAKGRRPKAETYSNALRDLLRSQDIGITWTIDGKKKSLDIISSKNMYYGMAAVQISEALRGSTKATKEIIDRVQGKSRQAIECYGKNEHIEIIIGSNNEL